MQSKSNGLYNAPQRLGTLCNVSSGLEIKIHSAARLL